MSSSIDTGAELERLRQIMARLRAEGGCPWDREQDLRSLRPYLVEEAYEVLEEMDKVAYGGPWRPLCEELGDLLFQIVFHAQLAQEKGEFTLAEVCRAISDKIVSRHPHVFGEVKVQGAPQVLENWARLKADERRKKHGTYGSVLDGVPAGAPALLRAERLTEKASRIGFDWPDLAGVRGKLAEELAELDQAISSGKRDEIEHELGDVLFSLANLARFVATPAEDALRQANRRFTERFHGVEAGLAAQGVPFGKATLPQMDALWDGAKLQEKAAGKVRARVHGLSLTTARFAETEAFLSALAKAVGLERLSSGQGEVRYAAAGLEICYREDKERLPGPPFRLELEASSRQAIEALHAALIPMGAERPGPLAVEIRDPDGNAWRFAYSP
ncbi:MAG: nucleoside triphosphate pyrophosphohydrolase [Myxococcaceae bacterium]